MSTARPRGAAWRGWCGAVLCCAALLGPASAARGCEAALVLAMDVSGSVDEGEWRLQRDGLAAALRDPAIIDALTRGQVAVAVVQWSGPAEQALSIGWRRVLSAGHAADLAAATEAMPRAFAGGETAVGAAIAFAARQFAAVPDCGRRILDLSGDGTENAGHDVGLRRQEAVRDGIEINGLAIESHGIAITGFYRRWVIGPGGFVITATGHLDYARAIRAKILRELARPTG